jgi:hypothetical protein
MSANRFTRRPSQRPGNILPLALVIMTSILLAGLGLGMIVLASLRRTAEVDASTVSYYAADAGVERQLYELRKQAATVPSLATLNGTFSNGSTWSTPTSTYLQTTIKTFSTISSTTFQFVDLYDPDNISAAAGVGRVDWSWSAGSDCTGGIAPDVELGYSEWLSGGSVLPSQFTIDLGTTEGGEVTLLNSLRGYRLRFRPKQCSASNLRVTLCPTSSACSPTYLSFPGDITVSAEGKYLKTTQNISVTVPRQDVLSGVFTYALFSECQLYKNPDSPIVCP